MSIPARFINDGTSGRRRNPKRVAKTGVNEAIGERRDTGECLIAQVAAINATISRILTKMRR